ncbi:MAG TPA: adenylate/guanylate cyclase domain-containing protein [Leptospiraceae bacterium]|nr:adenylate/guanylate cyclase domain-containing protein [Leptospiraceae bacterium]
MKSKAVSVKDISELYEILIRIEKEDFYPTFAAVFASDEFSGQELSDFFRSRNISVFGSSSREEISENSLNSGSASVLLMDIPKEFFRVKLFPLEDSAELGRKVSKWAFSEFNDPQVLLTVGGAGLTVFGDSLVQGLFESHPKYPVFGALASAKKDIYKPFIFNDTESVKDGVLAWVLDGKKYRLHGTAISGWQEIGTPKTVTKSNENYVLEINNEPALDLYRKYFQIYGTADEQMLISEYPISLLRENGGRAIRTAVSIDFQTKAIHYGGNIPEGSQIRFCTPNIAKTIQNTVHELNEFIQDEEVQNPSLMILFDCAIRSRSLGIHMQKEIQLINELWNVPMIGFSSWGEIGSTPKSACDFHNTTIALALLTEIGSPSAERQRKKHSEDDVSRILEANEVAGNKVQDLKEQIIRLQREKTILSNFLYHTSRDLDSAMIEIGKEREKSERLLLNILPEEIAERLKKGENTIADSFTEASILFADLVGFTSLSARMNPSDLVHLLNDLFTEFDRLCSKHNAEKIKTIGDAYMAVSGLPVPDKNHAETLYLLAKDIIEYMPIFNSSHGTELSVRIGINSGSVTAGVIGTQKISYDLWGDAVNTASRMESSGIPGKIHISESAYILLKDKYSFEERGEIEIKGKGKMKTYLGI